MSVVAVALLLLLTAGCARSKPDTPVSEPKPAAAHPATPPTPAKPVRPETPRTAAAAVPARGVEPAAPKAPVKGTPPLAKTAAAPPPLDLKAMTEQLKETKAIGIFTKITLKNQVDDLLDRFREYYQGKARFSMTDLRRSFDLLMMKVLSLLQNEDQTLASAIVSSREAIWSLLADPKKFASLDI